MNMKLIFPMALISATAAGIIFVANKLRQRA